MPPSIEIGDQVESDLFLPLPSPRNRDSDKSKSVLNKARSASFRAFVHDMTSNPGNAPNRVS